jgi:pimeloyl-ACP methyl ester carboxylesterase
MTMKFPTDLADPAAALKFPEYDCPMNFAINSALGGEWSRFIGEPDVRERVAAISAPVLIVGGAADPRTDLGARDLAALLPGSHLAMLHGVGHYPWLEHPELLRAELRAALAPFPAGACL